MLHICCIRAGDQFSPAYPDILYDMVRRNLAEGFEGDFTCFTDQPDVLLPGIINRPLPADLPRWWSKLALHRQGLFPDGDRVLYFDLACVITGRLDELAAYDGPFAALRDLYRFNEGLQSAVMAWESGTTTDIWNSYERAGCPTDYRNDETWGDQAWLEKIRLHHTVRLQNKFPELIVSYKFDNVIKNPPDKASVVCFHGKPKPHELTEGWVPEVWKIGGMTRAELDSVCNTKMEHLVDNVRINCQHRIPWMDTSEPHDGHAVIVGGGPSVKGKTLEIRWRQSLGQKIWALNGSADWLRSQGITVDFHVLADARPENIEFVRNAVDRTVYLISSQCDPTVFDALGYMGVILWHPNIAEFVPVISPHKDKPQHLFGGGSTVGLNAMVLAFGAGYRKFHLYGFDSSYLEDIHHAYSQPLNDADLRIDAICAGKKFVTSPWMVQQTNEFAALASELTEDCCIITVAGEGLLPTMAHEMMATPQLQACDIRAAEVLERIRDISNPVGAEVGVFAADMSRALLRNHEGLKLIMVDSWESNGAAYEGESGDWHQDLTQDQQDKYFDMATQRTAFANDRREIIRERSTVAAQKLNGTRLDFVFIDADHSYPGCKADIEAWEPKVKAGGWLMGHDYENNDFPKFGVKQAVDEFIAAHGLKLELGENYVWAARKPDLSR